jgi:hypothetical protein
MSVQSERAADCASSFAVRLATLDILGGSEHPLTAWQGFAIVERFLDWNRRRPA